MSRNKPNTIQDHKILATGPTQRKAFAQQLSRAFLKEYDLDSPSCIFAPGVAFRIWRANEAVDILICFHCDEFKIFGKKIYGPLPLEYEATRNLPDRAALVRLAQQAFPDDYEIQSLPDKCDLC